MRTAWLLVALATAAPLASAQAPVDGCTRQCRPLDPDVNAAVVDAKGQITVILYAHVLTALGPAVMNTQPPLPEESDLQITTHPLMVEPDGVLLEAQARSGVLSQAGDGQWRMPWGHMPVRPIHMHSDPVAYVYVSSDGPMPPGLRLSSQIAIGTRPESRSILAEGASDAVAAADAAQEGVREFRIPHTVRAKDWRAAADSRDTITWTVRAEVPFPDPSSTKLLRVHTGPRFMPRVLLSILEPIRVEALSFTTSSAYAVGLDVVTPFGASDIDNASLVLDVPVESGLRVSTLHLRDPRHYHDGEAMPLRATWALEGALAEPGRFHGTIRALNAQGTARLVADVPLEKLALQPANGLPGPDALFAALALAAVGAFARRRL